MGIVILVGLVVILFVVGIFAYLITIYNSLEGTKESVVFQPVCLVMAELLRIQGAGPCALRI